MWQFIALSKNNAQNSESNKCVWDTNLILELPWIYSRASTKMGSCYVEQITQHPGEVMAFQLVILSFYTTQRYTAMFKTDHQ
jgi:hypothetical protein